LFLAAVLLGVCFSSCSQGAAPGQSVAGVFTATTPCDDVSKKLLNIAPDTKYEMMKWNIGLQQDPKTLNPTTYKLVVKYGLAKQGTRDLMPGAETIELKGKWEMGKKIPGNPAATVYTLTADNSPVSLSFLKVNANLLHLLDVNYHLVVGNGAWSYTLNRVEPVPAAPSKLFMQTGLLPLLPTDSLIVGVFDGRTPCNTDLLALSGISTNGCQIIKCRLTLYQDVKMHTPTTFQLYTIYVGKGNTKYSTTGKWMIVNGISDDPTAIVYQLQPDSGKPASLSFMKADDNILFMLDANRNLLVGNEYVSFTLNKNKK
ncbi:MAG TPA: copper resistance protein NlpE N-terminal domain-containing protein, partial [Chitinophagaceae bacterium]|nr:copper resistance protein NlpE N-terminal domain-containing protein [Chitinophagaceae bacterium]